MLSATTVLVNPTLDMVEVTLLVSAVPPKRSPIVNTFILTHGLVNNISVLKFDAQVATVPELGDTVYCVASATSVILIVLLVVVVNVPSLAAMTSV